MASSRSKRAPVPTPTEWLTELSLDIQNYTGLINERLGQMANNQVRLRARVDDAALAIATLGRDEGRSMPAEVVLRIADEIAGSMQSMETAAGNFKRRHDDILGSLNNLSSCLGPCLERAWEAEERRGRQEK
ncbi:hypothetical protein DL765_001913 [Monosporascus sp. GIB2]|nr:hypothetical protein DL765_001913 [Monosporascus sp. GIB2]